MIADGVNVTDCEARFRAVGKVAGGTGMFLVIWAVTSRHSSFARGGGWREKEIGCDQGVEKSRHS